MPIDFTKSKYSPKACKFLSKDPLEFPLLTLMCGSVRSGKTINVIYKIPQYFATIGNEYLKVFSGFSKNTVRNNVLIELIPYLENFHGAKVKYNSSSGEMDIKLWGKNYSCLVVGGGKSDSFAAIQGGTWDFWYANELPQHHYSFYNMALSRLTPEQARGIADANPESTNHWLYQEKIKKWLDGDEEVKKVFDYWHFTMDDNANLSKTFVENQKRLYSGAFYERKILGQWVIAEGLVYDTFDVNKHTISRDEVLEMIEQGKFCDYFFGLDWGWEHPTGICLFGVTYDGVYIQIDELKKVHFDHTNAKDWLLKKQTEYGKFWRFGNCDNARPEQNTKLNETFCIYEDKPVSVADSIAIVRQLINFDRLIICRENCPDTIQEITNYRYPQEYEVTASTDIDKPVKEFDDLMDAMRYGVWFYEVNYGMRFRGKYQTT